MKKFVALSALAIAAAAGTVNAQNYTLNLYMTARAISSGVDDSGAADSLIYTDVQTGGSITATPGSQYLIEVRYNISVSGTQPSPATGSIGLSAAQIHISGSSGAGSVSRGELTNFLFAGTDSQGNALSSAILNPDNSNDAASGTGLVNLFRGGLTTDQDAGNGNVTATNTPGLSVAGFDIVPLALSAPGQKSFTGSSPTATNNTSANRWAIYDFLYTVGTSNNTLTAAAVADASTGNAFGFFQQAGTVKNPVPVTSTLSNPGSITFVVPAPASAALLGLGGLVATRRRRA